MHVFIPGGAGYVGSLLVPALLDAGYEVTVYDLFLYGKEVFDDIKDHPKLKLIKGDIRNLKEMEAALNGRCTLVIHLACISNDPSFELNPDLGKSINLDPFEPFVQVAKRKGVKRFIYASSSSVYGVKDVPNVTEDMELKPLTDYSKFKAACEKILLKYQDKNFTCCVLRPATVCGYAPRQRLDVVVNILTNLAFNTGRIKVMGGDQLRPNIHVRDMVRAYLHVLEAPAEKIQGEIFNVGYHNYSVQELGDIVQSTVGRKKDIDLEKIPTDDNRSYHVSSQKIADKLGFTPNYTIQDAVDSLVEAFEDGKLPNSLDDKRYFNIKTMKAINLQ
ncbi:NAD-dependent epimerase/dehydratase family protein [Candidatus Neptunichlamydia sp. REUL1]|uniref:NAD-dependent epimerase/dehydratase family protein n=1 Tax=Candidatus Neptunichlamydia sp. REUL1 TaxID=3064277 RepID=UPI0029315E50|nr:SDR family oxidoreductase [Candidatus Neptunochlamydia sp. REUL1]